MYACTAPLFLDRWCGGKFVPFSSWRMSPQPVLERFVHARLPDWASFMKGCQHLPVERIDTCSLAAVADRPTMLAGRYQRGL